ncbi:hypothetical protein ACEXQD_18300 [Herbiconiux sp. P15]|uniref:hypothetical protein n=1 Tax=Herbiconiux liukaitaii TaxID=3342799 RepID=UPI0035BA53A8
MSFKFDEGAWARIQADVNAKAQNVIREVNATHAGRPADEVAEALRVGLREIGAEPTEAGVREYAQSISDGTLVDNI